MVATLHSWKLTGSFWAETHCKYAYFELSQAAPASSFQTEPSVNANICSEYDRTSGSHHPSIRLLYS